MIPICWYSQVCHLLSMRTDWACWYAFTNRIWERWGNVDSMISLLNTVSPISLHSLGFLFLCTVVKQGDVSWRALWFYGVVTCQGTEGILQLMTSETLKSSKNPQGIDSCQLHEWSLKSDPKVSVPEGLRFLQPFLIFFFFSFLIIWLQPWKRVWERVTKRLSLDFWPKETIRNKCFKLSGFRVICYEAVYNSCQPTCL